MLNAVWGDVLDAIEMAQDWGKQLNFYAL